MWQVRRNAKGVCVDHGRDRAAAAAVRPLPTFPAAILVLVHMPPYQRSELATRLSRLRQTKIS